MKNIFRILCILLVACFTLTAFAACGDKEDESVTSSEEQKVETSEDEGGFRLEKKDFGDVTIKVLTDKTNDFLACEIAPLELNTEPVNDAAYDRATLISQEYGISIEQVHAENQSKVIETAREMITTNTDEYQIYCAAVYYLAILSVEDMFVDLANITQNDYIDLKQPYWDQAIVNDLSLLGSTYFATGDALVTDDEATWAIFYNKDIADNNHLAEAYDATTLYQIVSRGDWTLDMMHEMAKTATNVTGGTMEFSVDTDDTWGLAAQCYDSYAFTVGADQSITRIENDVPVITIGEEANINAYDKVFTILTDKQCTGIAEIDGRAAGSSDVYGDQITLFANGHALFMPYRVAAASMQQMREADIRYGILPMPKLDDKQDDYSSTITVYWCSALAIPASNVEKFDATCYAMEALAYYGQETLTPEYYERTLKYKRFPDDDEAAESLDLIFKNKSYDIGAVFNFGSMLSFYTDILLTGSNSHASTLEAKQSSYQSAIDSFVEMLRAE